MNHQEETIIAAVEQRMRDTHGHGVRVQWRFLLMSQHCRQIDGRELTPEMTATFNQHWPTAHHDGLHAILQRIHDDEGTLR